MAVEGPEADDVYTPAPASSPVVAAFEAAGLHVEALGGGAHRVTCPWAAEHGGSASSEATYLEPDATHPVGTFRCAHGHAERPDMGRVLKHLGLEAAIARARPRIRVVPGDTYLAAAAAERELAGMATFFHSGGPIVRIAADSPTGGVSTELVNDQTLIAALSAAIEWEKRDGRTDRWQRCDPPSQVVQMLMKAQKRTHLQEISALAHQPFFRADGTLVTTPGYDAASGTYAAFDAAQFVLPEPTRDAAEDSLAYLNWLLREFHFASDVDRSTAVCAMLTAAVRASLPLAPAFSISATKSGSGKSYLASVIAPLAGPGEPHNVSYPTTPEEATKVVLAMLLERPPVILFDDMQHDWKPYGALNKALTSPKVTERLLGVSRTATAPTSSLILGTGNNIEPERDMRRRVNTIRLTPPAVPITTLKYREDPAAHVRRNRGRAVSAALTIVRAYRAAGGPRAEVPDLPSYGAWSAMCRQPLIWLGEPDPASSIIEQINHDPDQELLAVLLNAWADCFGFRAVTVRKVLDTAQGDHDLMDALMDLPVVDGKYVNPGRLGWYLKRKAGVVADGFRIEPGDLTERRSWKVVAD